MAAWAGFFQVQAGASASLLGLVFVGLSVSFAKIIESPHLPNRALEALVVLGLNLIAAMVLLIPGLTVPQLGAAILGLALLVWLGVSALHVANLRTVEVEHRHHAVISAIIGQMVLVSWIAAGALVMIRGGAGLYLLAPTLMLGYVLALFHAWVLLVEINR
jgi:modulator of FtsH protease